MINSYIIIRPFPYKQFFVTSSYTEFHSINKRTTPI